MDAACFQLSFAGHALCFSPSPAMKCRGQGERKLSAKPPSLASPCCPGTPEQPLARSPKARSYQHCSGVRKVPWGQGWGDRGHHEKSQFEGSAWKDNGWRHGEGASSPEQGLCVPSSPLPPPDPFWAWDTQKICCSFSCRTVGRKFCQVGNFATALSARWRGTGMGEGHPSQGPFGSKKEGAHRRLNRPLHVQALVPQAAASASRRQPSVLLWACQGALSLAGLWSE